MMELKSVDAWSFARIYGLIGVAIGFVIGLIIAVVSIVAGSAGGTLGTKIAAGIGVAAIVIFPIFYGIMLLVVGFLLALLYNYIAGKIGGVKVDLRQVK